MVSQKTIEWLDNMSAKLRSYKDVRVAFDPILASHYEQSEKRMHTCVKPNDIPTESLPRTNTQNFKILVAKLKNAKMQLKAEIRAHAATDVLLIKFERTHFAVLDDYDKKLISLSNELDEMKGETESSEDE